MSTRTIEVSFPNAKMRTIPIVYSAKLRQDRYMHDLGVVVLRNWDLPEKLIAPGTPMLIQLRSIKGTKQFPGFVSHIKKVIQTDKRFIEITFIGASNRMKQKRKKVWKKVTVSQVARKIAKDYKFAADVTNHPRVFSQLAQHGESDWEFLVKCAKKCGYLFRVEGTTLIFKPIDEYFNKYKYYAPTYTIANLASDKRTIVGSDLYSFNPLIGENIPFPDSTKSAKSYSGVNPYTKKSHKYSSQRNVKGKRQNIKPPLFDTFDTNVVAPGIDIAKSHSDAFAEINKFPYRANGSVIGSPNLMPGMPIYLNGVGTEFNGYWIVLSLEHIIHNISPVDFKYVTNIEVGIDSLGPTNYSANDSAVAPLYENVVYVEPNIRQIAKTPSSLLRTIRIPTNNDFSVSYGKLTNRKRDTRTRAIRSESYSFWESQTPSNIRLRQNKPSNRSAYVAQKVRRRCCP